MCQSSFTLLNFQNFMNSLKYAAIVALSFLSSVVSVFAAPANASFTVQGRYCLSEVCIGDSGSVLPEFNADSAGQYDQTPDCHARITGLTRVVRKTPDFDLSVELRADPFGFKPGMAPADYYKVTRVLLEYRQPELAEAT